MRNGRFGRILGPAIALTIFVLVPSLRAEAPVTPEEIVRTLAGEVSGETARRYHGRHLEVRPHPGRARLS